MAQRRENWIDCVKLFACVLVALGHFFQSMVASGILAESLPYGWFQSTIYYFHVPLFFLCSGYLHQKTCDASFGAWRKNLLKKGIVLGVPYFVFSFATWGLKTLFAGEVNIQCGGLLESLFLSPISPYWYLYALFGIFIVTPAFCNKKMALVGLLCALGLKVLNVFHGETGVYMIDTICANVIWFVLGMWLCVWRLPEKLRTKVGLAVGVGSAGLFLASSIVLHLYSVETDGIHAIMGLVGCSATVLIVLQSHCQSKVLDKLAQYTMPVFLMHTIFAAGVRAVLLKLGIADPIVHVALGLATSFVGPVVAAEIMKKLKLDILFDPGKYIKFTKQTKEQGNV